MALGKQGQFTVGTPPRETFEPEDQRQHGDGPPGGCILTMAVVVILMAALAWWITL